MVANIDSTPKQAESPAQQSQKASKVLVIPDEVSSEDTDSSMSSSVDPVVVLSMEVCLIRFGSWTPSMQNPVAFQSNGILFNFSGKLVLRPNKNNDLFPVTRPYVQIMCRP